MSAEQSLSSFLDKWLARWPEWGIGAVFLRGRHAVVPLIEIVSEPDIRSGEEATDYMARLRQLLIYLDVCDGNEEFGSDQRRR